MPKNKKKAVRKIRNSARITVPVKTLKRIYRAGQRGDRIFVKGRVK